MRKVQTAKPEKKTVKAVKEGKKEKETGFYGLLEETLRRYSYTPPKDALEELWKTWNSTENKTLDSTRLFFNILCSSHHPRAQSVFKYLAEHLAKEGRKEKLGELIEAGKGCVGEVILNRFSAVRRKKKRVAVLLPLKGSSTRSLSDTLSDAVLSSLGEKDWFIEFFDETNLGNCSILDNFTLVLGPLSSKRVPKIASCGKPTLVFTQRNIPKKENLLRLRLSLEREAEILCKWAFRRGMRRFVIFYPKDPVGEKVAQAFKRKVLDLGGEIVGEEGYDKGTSDFWMLIKRVFYPEFKRESPEKLVRDEKKEIEEEIYGDEPYMRSPSLDSLFEMIYQSEPVKFKTKRDPLGGVDAVFMPDTLETFFLFYSQLYYRGVEGVRVLGVSFLDSPGVLEKTPISINPVFFTGYYPFKKGERKSLLFILVKDLLNALARAYSSSNADLNEILDSVKFLKNSITFTIKNGEIIPLTKVIKLGRGYLECVFSEEPGGGSKNPGDAEGEDIHRVSGSPTG